MGLARVERAAGHMAPEQLTGLRAAQALHHPVVGIPAAGIEAGDDALPGALVLVVRRIEQLEGAAHQLLAGGAEDRQRLPVGIGHQPLTRQHQPDRCQFEGGAVVQALQPR